MINQIVPAVRITLVLAVFTGLLFPCAITAIAQICFPKQANGSLVVENGKVTGSELLGQQFSKPEFFHPRPSAAGNGYAGEASGGTNLGPTSKKLIEGDGSFAGVKQLVEQYRRENHLPAQSKVPVDAVTRSGSGLDPAITPANALLQASRVARERNVPFEQLQDLIKANTEERTLGFIGEPAVNVLRLNLALDSLKKEINNTAGP